MSTDAVKKELSDLSRNGLLTPAAVLAWAEVNPDSALHKQFEWEDTEAAKQWRLHQARELIIRVKITVEDRTGREIQTRKYVSLERDRHPSGGYREVTTVLSDAELRTQLLAEAQRDLAALRRKYATLSELSEIFRSIDKLTVTLAEQQPAAV